MEIKGILFDKDGTLIDFYEVWGTAAEAVMKHLAEKYGTGETEKLSHKLLEALGVHGGIIDSEGALAWKSYDLIAKDLIRAMEQNGISACFDDLKQYLVDGFYEEVCVKRHDYPMFADLKNLMQYLHGMGIKTGLATTDGYASARVCMERIGIDQEISFYGTGGLGYPEKPDGNLVIQAAEEWNINPEEIAVVGDTPNDMRFAKNGNAVGIAVLSGVGKREELELLADYIIDSVDDLIELLETNKKEQKGNGTGVSPVLR